MYAIMRKSDGFVFAGFENVNHPIFENPDPEDDESFRVWISHDKVYLDDTLDEICDVTLTNRDDYLIKAIRWER